MTLLHFYLSDGMMHKNFYELKAKKKNNLVSGNAVDKKNLHPGGCEFFFFFFFDQFNWMFSLLFVEKQRVLPFIVQREKNVNSSE